MRKEKKGRSARARWLMPADIQRNRVVLTLYCRAQLLLTSSHVGHEHDAIFISFHLVKNAFYTYNKYTSSMKSIF